MSFSRAALASMAAVVVLFGCDLPTSAPIVTQRWVVPIQNTTIGVADLLPSGVSDNGSTFAVTVDPFSTSESLGALCSDCVVLNGTTVPKPAFTGSFSTSASMPSRVVTATLVSGTVALAIHNGFAFDPIRPGAGNTGTLTITLSDGQGGPVIGQVVLDGATEAMPPGSTVNKTADLTPGTFGPTLWATLDLASPAGDPVTIDTGESLSVTATPSNILVSSAEVDVAGQGVDVDTISLDVSDIDQRIVDAIDEGGFVLDIANPFGVSVATTLQIAGSGFAPITKSFTVPAEATSSTPVAMTADELKSFLGKPDVQLTGEGTVTTASTITVSPGEEIVIDAQLDLTLSFGG